MHLAKVRKKQGFTQDTLSKEVGVSRGLIAQVENGDRRAYPSLRARIADALNVEETKIFR